jgi:hypothetical protein
LKKRGELIKEMEFNKELQDELSKKDDLKLIEVEEKKKDLKIKENLNKKEDFLKLKEDLKINDLHEEINIKKGFKIGNNNLMNKVNKNDMKNPNTDIKPNKDLKNNDIFIMPKFILQIKNKIFEKSQYCNIFDLYDINTYNKFNFISALIIELYRILQIKLPSNNILYYFDFIKKNSQLYEQNDNCNNNIKLYLKNELKIEELEKQDIVIFF